MRNNISLILTQMCFALLWLTFLTACSGTKSSEDAVSKLQESEKPDEANSKESRQKLITVKITYSELNAQGILIGEKIGSTRI